MSSDKKDLSRVKSNPTGQKFSDRKREWDEIEELVLVYQKQFDEKYEDDELQIEESQQAAAELIERFDPLIKKYLIIVTTGRINFNDTETRTFVSAFLGDRDVRATMKRQRQSAKTRKEVYENFNFVVVTYGQLDEEVIKSDLQSLLLRLAKRYEVMGRSFCGYVATTYKFEVLRHIKKYLGDPLNIHYRHKPYEDIGVDDHVEGADYRVEDDFYIDNSGLPDLSWVQGTSCSDYFHNLEVMERKVLIKYYLEDNNDREIAEGFGINVNTANKIRRSAAEQVAENVGLDKEDIVRSRKVSKSFSKVNKDLFEE